MSIDRLPFQAHLEELRKRLIVCVVVFIIAFVVCYIGASTIANFLALPIKSALPPNTPMVFTRITEAFFVYLKIAFWAALILTMPVILYELWAFISPGLYEHEKRLIKRFLIAGIGLFILGGCFGYWVIMPVVLSITLGYISQGLTAYPRIESYLLFAIKCIFTFGIAFELPFLMAFVTSTGIIEPDYFKKNRKGYYIALFCLAIFLAPTDIFSQILLFGPMALLYEIGIRLGRWIIPKKKKSPSSSKDDINNLTS